MNRRITQLLDTMNRVEDFLAKNRPTMEGLIASAPHERFSASRRRLEEFVRAQNEHDRQGRASVVTKTTRRARLVRKHMLPVARIARAELPQVPELDKLTVVPRGRGYGALVAAAHGMARAAQSYEATFVESGLPADFIPRLLATADALQESILGRSQVVALRIRATAGLHTEASEARRRLAVLDTLVRVAVEENDVLLAQWRSLSRVVATATAVSGSSEVTNARGTANSPSSSSPTAGGGTGASSSAEVASAA